MQVDLVIYCECGLSHVFPACLLCCYVCESARCNCAKITLSWTELGPCFCCSWPAWLCRKWWKHDTIITGDESLIYGYDLKTMAQSLQWITLMSPRPKKKHDRDTAISRQPLTGFFRLQWNCSSWKCSIRTDNQQGILVWNFAAFEGCSLSWKADIAWEWSVATAPWQCACSCTATGAEISCYTPHSTSSTAIHLIMPPVTFSSSQK